MLHLQSALSAISVPYIFNLAVHYPSYPLPTFFISLMHFGLLDCNVIRQRRTSFANFRLFSNVTSGKFSGFSQVAILSPLIFLPFIGTFIHLKFDFTISVFSRDSVTSLLSLQCHCRALDVKFITKLALVTHGFLISRT